jgi:hypothetical protein
LVTNSNWGSAIGNIMIQCCRQVWGEGNTDSDGSNTEEMPTMIRGIDLTASIGGMTLPRHYGTTWGVYQYWKYACYLCYYLVFGRTSNTTVSSISPLVRGSCVLPAKTRKLVFFHE